MQKAVFTSKTGTNTPSASNAGWIGTYPGSFPDGIHARSAETKTERKIRKMGKIVIKTTRKSNVSKVKVRGFKEFDAAKIAFCTFIGIMSGLNQEDKNLILCAAATIIQDVADKAGSEPEEEKSCKQ
jgi:hypothetical protein